MIDILLYLVSPKLEAENKAKEDAKVKTESKEDTKEA